MKQLKKQSIERYFKAYIVIRSHDIEIKDIPNLSETEYIKRTGRTSSEYRLVKSLATNDYVQIQLNDYIKEKGLESKFIKFVEVKDYYEIAPTPTKKEIPEIKQKRKQGVFHVFEVIDDKKEVRWIKARDNRNLQKQINIIEKEYKVKITAGIYHGKRKYKSFITDDFTERLKGAEIL